VASRIQFNSANGGVFETSGTFNRTLATNGNSAVQWLAGSGGFSANGGALTVDLNNLGTRDTLTWGVTPFFVTNGQKLVFGSRTADSMVDWYDNLDLGSSGTNSRIIEVRDNSFSTGDFVRITGDVLGDTNQTLLKTGTGLLELPNLKSFTGPVLVGGGMLRYTNLPSATPLILTGGVYGTSGTITRSLTNGASMVAWSPVTGGGFAAIGGPLTVYVDNGASDPLNLNVTTNFLKLVSGVTGYSLILNSAFADNVVTFSNNLTTGSAGGNNWFIFQVDDNPSTTNDRAVLAGCFNTTSGRGVQKNGVGTLELINTNTFASTFNVNDGTVSLNCPSGNALTSAALSIGDGIGAPSSAVMRLLRPNQISDTATVNLFADGLFDMNGFDETVGTFSFATNGVLDTGTNTLSVSTQYPIAALVGATGTVNGRIRVLMAASGSYAGTLVINAVFDTAAGFGLRGTSDAMLIFTNPNNIFRGSLSISDGGNIILRGSNVLNGVTVVECSTIISALSAANKSVMIDGPYTVTQPLQRTYVGLSGAVHTFGGMNTGAGRAVYTNTLSLAGNTATLPSNWPINLTAVLASDVVEFGGAINDVGASTNPVVIPGNGSVIFSSVTNAYRGTTTVSNGTLLVNGKLLSGGDTVTVMNGATLGGTGMIARAVVVAAGGTITAGASRTGDVGVLTISNNVTLAANAKLLCDFSGTTNDVLRVTGTLTLPTTATVVVSPIGTPGVVYPRVLFSANTLAGVSGELTGWVLTDPRVGRIVTQGNNVVMLAKSNGLALIIR